MRHRIDLFVHCGNCWRDLEIRLADIVTGIDQKARDCICDNAWGSTAYYEANEPKGECVLVIEGKSREELRQKEVAKWEEMSIEEHIDFYLEQGVG